MTASELSQAKLTNPCRKCAQLGHWADAHQKDGSLKPGTLSFSPQETTTTTTGPGNDTKNQNDGNNISSSNQTKPPIVGFMANLSSNEIVPPRLSNTLVCVSTYIGSPSQIGPMVDDGAPFSAIGEVELRYHSRRLLGGSVHLLDKASELGDSMYWQFGTGSHASPSRRILGSVILSLLTDSSNVITIKTHCYRRIVAMGTWSEYHTSV